MGGPMGAQFCTGGLHLVTFLIGCGYRGGGIGPYLGPGAAMGGHP
jgi:hypothetical protein